MAVTLLVHVGETDMVGPLALPLDPGVLQPGRWLARDHFGDRVGPVRRSREPG